MGEKDLNWVFHPESTTFRLWGSKKRKHFYRWIGVWGGENMRSQHKKTNILHSAIKLISGLQPNNLILFFNYRISSFMNGMNLAFHSFSHNRKLTREKWQMQFLPIKLCLEELKSFPFMLSSSYCIQLFSSGDYTWSHEAFPAKTVQALCGIRADIDRQGPQGRLWQLWAPLSQQGFAAQPVRVTWARLKGSGKKRISEGQIF